MRVALIERSQQRIALRLAESPAGPLLLPDELPSVVLAQGARAFEKLLRSRSEQAAPTSATLGTMMEASPGGHKAAYQTFRLRKLIVPPGVAYAEGSAPRAAGPNAFNVEVEGEITSAVSERA